jgi:hypothetical protein
VRAVFFSGKIPTKKRKTHRSRFFREELFSLIHHPSVDPRMLPPALVLSRPLISGTTPLACLGYLGYDFFRQQKNGGRVRQLTDSTSDFTPFNPKKHPRQASTLGRGFDSIRFNSFFHVLHCLAAIVAACCIQLPTLHPATVHTVQR